MGPINIGLQRIVQESIQIKLLRNNIFIVLHRCHYLQSKLSTTTAGEDVSYTPQVVMLKQELLRANTNWYYEADIRMFLTDYLLFLTMIIDNANRIGCWPIVRIVIMTKEIK